MARRMKFTQEQLIAAAKWHLLRRGFGLKLSVMAVRKALKAL